MLKCGGQDILNGLDGKTLAERKRVYLSGDTTFHLTEKRSRGNNGWKTACRRNFHDL